MIWMLMSERILLKCSTCWIELFTNYVGLSTLLIEIVVFLNTIAPLILLQIIEIVPGGRSKKVWIPAKIILFNEMVNPG